MRPGQVCPGKRAAVSGRGEGAPASMRPGQVCPGKSARMFLQSSPDIASMRPGQVCPGKADKGENGSWRVNSLQ